MRKLRQLENCICCGLATPNSCSLSSQALSVTTFYLVSWWENTHLPLKSIPCWLLIRPMAQLIDICTKFGLGVHGSVCVWVCVRSTTINPAIENFPLFISLFWGIFSPTLETTQHFGTRHRNLNHNLYHNRTIAAQLLIVPSASTFPSCPASLSLCHPLRPRRASLSLA